MSSEELRALEALTLNWTRDLKDVWAPCGYHIEGLHPQAVRPIRRGIDDAFVRPESNPLGIAIMGEAGVGKTHLLGWTREQVQLKGGYFFLVGDLSQTGFWDEVLATVVVQLQPLEDGSRRQLEKLLTDLAEKAALDGTVLAAVTGRETPSPKDVGAFITALRRLAPSTIASQDTARALVLLASPQFNHQDIGYNFFFGEIETEERRRWGIMSRPKMPKLVIQELSGLLALSGPTVLAIDQIDALIDAVNRASDGDTSQRHAVTDAASGLMTLRDMTHRTLTVISCLPETWDYVNKYAIGTVTDRFRQPVPLQNIPSADVGRLMIEKRFASGFASVSFKPSYPSWPIRPEAFEEADRYTARTLLQRIDAHVSRCVDEQVVRELDRLGGVPEGGSGQVRVASGTSSPVAERHLVALDERFRELRESIDVSKAFVPDSEDEQMSAWLTAGLEAWIKEHGGAEENLFVTERLSRRNPPLHASLRMITDARTERQRRWAFRAIAADHHKAVQSRLRKAVAEAGLGAEGTERQLFVLRNTPWPSGPVTERETAEFAAKGGIALTVTGEDLKTFGALKEMLVKLDPELRGWLIARQPAHHTELLSRTLGDAMQAQQSGQPREAMPALAPPSRDRTQLTAGTSPSIRVGTAAVGQMPVSLDLASLRRHVSVFAGAGSGKTVLLRRIIEECALHGVSSIVLDHNNDLARLGDAWPQPPETWGDDDAERARDYLENTDVVIWTPGVDGGRPLSFQPLSVFTDVLDDIDSFRAAVDASTITRATTIAAELADRLRSARVNDRLFAGSGEPVDPGMLLCPPPNKRARVSVVSLAGLLGLEQRQSFVNQLQIALLSWIKRNPAVDRPLGGLFVMDEAQEFAPSGRGTPCRESTLRLVAQARKYGLGMLFATQQPKGLQNSIPNNSTTQFYGLLLAGAQIDAARELARVKGGDVPDIGRLKAGQFYIATEGSGFRKIRTSMCLSYHPSSPLAEEEVIKRASGR